MINLNDENFETEVIKSNQLTVVDFWAEWCGPCKMMGPVFDETSKDLPNVKFVKVNIDSSPASAANYGIMSIPTILIFKDGKNVDQIVGLVQKDKLVSLIKKHL